MNQGDIFYSKKLRTFVVFEGNFEDGYGYYCPSVAEVALSEAEVGELEPVVRELHYKVAIERSEDFLAAFKAASAHLKGLDRDEPFSMYRAGFEDALKLITERIQRRGKTGS